MGSNWSDVDSLITSSRDYFQYKRQSKPKYCIMIRLTESEYVDMARLSLEYNISLAGLSRRAVTQFLKRTNENKTQIII